MIKLMQKKKKKKEIDRTLLFFTSDGFCPFPIYKVVISFKYGNKVAELNMCVCRAVGVL